MQLAPIDDPAPEARRVGVEDLDLGAALLDYDLVVGAADADRHLRIGRKTRADALVARLVVRGVPEVANTGRQVELVQIAAAALRARVEARIARFERRRRERCDDHLAGEDRG